MKTSNLKTSENIYSSFDWNVDFHTESFLRCFRTTERIMKYSEDDMEKMRRIANEGDAYAQYALGRWIYAHNNTREALEQAEGLFTLASKTIPDALAAYAIMWHYGETKENVMDIDKSNAILQEAALQGSEYAALQQARFRIYGLFCEAEPEKVVSEIEERLQSHDNPDPQWYTFLGYAYEECGNIDEAFNQYKRGAEKGEAKDYYYLYSICKERDDMELAEKYVTEGMTKGCSLCLTYQSEMSEDDFQELSDEEKAAFHELIYQRLHKGLSLGGSLCAFLLFVEYFYGGHGFPIDKERAFNYLRQGVLWGSVFCMIKLLEYIEEGEVSEPMSDMEIAEMWLCAARYSPQDDDAIAGLSRVSNPAFLLKHKEELERYWMPLFPEKTSKSSEPAQPEKTPIEPVVIVIWPSGHLDIQKADVNKMKSFREMGETLIGADGLDAVHYSPMLQSIAKAANLDRSLAMYCDRNAQMKELDDNAIGTMLYGQGMEILGPIIICLEDKSYNCHSFDTLEDITATYNEINNHCDGLLIIEDEDDGRYDAYV